jgi:crotonobetainyl-CoA:carnitine CoA-transferase CaiB-like acyl-CoA transferase
MAGPLEGMLVVEMAWGSPGSIAGMLLADYGARVVKIERPGGGPDADSVCRAAWDRGKWSVEVDHTTTGGRELLISLLEQADVFLEGLGWGRAPRLGLSSDQLTAACPQLVHCSLTGYGITGPWSDRPGYDALVAARMGQMAEQSGPRPGPKFLGHPSVSYGTAFLATIATLAALHARRHTGRGQLVDVSLLDGVLAQSCMNWWWNEKETSYLARSGNEQGFGRGRIMTDLFLCEDGEWLMVHTGGSGSFKKAMNLLGFGDGIREVKGALEMSVPLDDDEYHITRHLAPEVFKTRPRQEWVELFHAHDLAALPVLHPGEILRDEQVRFAGVVIDLEGPGGRALQAAGPVIAFSESQAATPASAPAVGAHNDAVGDLLAGRSAAAVAAATAASAPAEAAATAPERRQALSGLRILDFSSFFAAGYASRLLSDLGADVIKVEPLVGDQMRPLPDPFEASQRGKRDIAVNLKSPASREIVRDLVRTADVVVLNLRPGKAEKIGLGYEDLKAIKPDLIYCYLPGFGSKGPKSGLKSFAPLLSGLTGLLWESAGEGAERPVRRAMGNEDYNNGFVGAIAILLGLAHRDATGEGQYIENPQLHSNLLVTTEQCIDADGNLVAGLTVDSQQMGWSSLYRLYPTSDGMICIACVGDRTWGRLRTALGLVGVPDDLSYAQAVDRSGAADVVVKALEARFAELTSEQAFALLEAKSIPSEIAIEHPHMPDFLWDDWALETGRVFEQQHAIHGYLREVGSVFHLSDSEVVNKGPSPLLGEHTVQILDELGYDDRRIAEMISSGLCLTAPQPTV